MRSPILLSLLLSLPAAPALSQDLVLDKFGGGLGRPLVCNLSGAPNEPYALLLDLIEFPTFLPALGVQIDITDQYAWISYNTPGFVGTLDGSGAAAPSVTMPNDPSLQDCVFSFQAVKNLPTADAGMICFADAEFDAKARKMSWLGIDKDTASRSSAKGTYKWRYDVPHLGFKYHGNSVMGAIGLVQLRYIDGDNQHRRMIADVYNHYLEFNPKIWLPKDVDGAKSSCHIYQVALNNRDEVLSGLNNLGIYPGVHYVDNSHYHMYRQYNPDTNTFSREISERLLSLPCHLEMDLDDAHRVAESLLEVVSELS